MKKIIAFLSVLTLVFVSCGDTNDVKSKKSLKEKKIKKKYSLKTKEGMLKKLETLGINIPGFFIYDSVKAKDGYKIKFTCECSKENDEKLKRWIDENIEKVKSSGWKERDYPTILGKAVWLYRKKSAGSSVTENLIISYLFEKDKGNKFGIKGNSISFNYQTLY